MDAFGIEGFGVDGDPDVRQGGAHGILDLLGDIMGLLKGHLVGKLNVDIDMPLRARFACAELVPSLDALVGSHHLFDDLLLFTGKGDIDQRHDGAAADLEHGEEKELAALEQTVNELAELCHQAQQATTANTHPPT